MEENVPKDTSSASKINFVSFNLLKYEDRLLMAHSGLDRYIGTAVRLLSKRIDEINLYKFDTPYFTSQNLEKLNRLISELLELIGKHSNERFGADPEKQHRFFQKISERNTFPVHLFVSRWNEKKNELTKSKANKAKFEKSSELPAYSPKLLRGLSGSHKVKYGASQMSETETRAVGVLYMVSLALNTIRDGAQRISQGKADISDLTRASIITVDIFSLLDDSAIMETHATGGRKGNKKTLHKEASGIIEKAVRRDPDLSTSILAKRVHQIIEGEGLKKVPSKRWIDDEIRKMKRKFT